MTGTNPYRSAPILHELGSGRPARTIPFPGERSHDARAAEQDPHLYVRSEDGLLGLTVAATGNRAALLKLCRQLDERSRKRTRIPPTRRSITTSTVISSRWPSSWRGIQGEAGAGPQVREDAEAAGVGEVGEEAKGEAGARQERLAGGSSLERLDANRTKTGRRT